MQAIRREHIELIPSNPDIRQRPWEAQLPNNRIENIAQISALDINRALTQNVRNDGVLDQMIAHAGLAVSVCVVECVELAHGW